MACRITDDCIACGTCIGRCPNNAVYVTVDEQYAIDPTHCTECVDQPRRRCETTCTFGAIEPDPEHQETVEERWAKHHALRAAATAEAVKLT